VLWLQGLVENLHVTTSMQGGHIATRRHPIDVREIVTSLQTVVAPLLLHKAQPLRLDLPTASAALPLAVADGRRIGQALLNLLLNASKYSPPGTPITVSVRARGAYVRVVVADRGPGLPPGNPAGLFAPFTRGEPAGESAPEGMGLGLAIVQQIVAAHGGRVGAASRRGGGARFWFDLPAQ